MPKRIAIRIPRSSQWVVHIEDPEVISTQALIYVAGPFSSEVSAEKWIDRNFEVINTIGYECQAIEVMDPSDVIDDMIRVSRTH